MRKPEKLSRRQAAKLIYINNSGRSGNCRNWRLVFLAARRFLWYDRYKHKTQRTGGKPI